MARVRAFGGALKNTKGTDSRRRTSGTQKERDKLERELRMWKVRGCLWAGSLFSALTGYASGKFIALVQNTPSLSSSQVAVPYALVTMPDFAPLCLLPLAFASILWTAWDPTYAVFRRSQFQGRAVRVHGRKQYIVSSVTFSKVHTYFLTLLGLAAFDMASTAVHGGFACARETPAR